MPSMPSSLPIQLQKTIAAVGQSWHRSMASKRLIAIPLLLISLTALILTSLRHSKVQLLDAIQKTQQQFTHTREVADDARNATLGFQKAFYISLPKRTDRQDAVTLLSAFTGIESIYQPGINGSEVDSKIVGQKLSAGVWGCWRSHANLWRHIVAEGINTALIMEDDIDWDVNLKDQMYRISKGIVAGPDLVEGCETDRSTPYGTGWDLFPMGYCTHTSNHTAKGSTDILTDRPVIRVDDPWMQDLEAQPGHKGEFARLKITREHQRATTRLESFYCTHAYAVTKAGAARLLYLLAYNDLTSPVDNSMSFAVEAGKLRGIVTVPPVISQFKIGNGFADSNNGATPKAIGEKFDQENGRPGVAIKNSARKAMKGAFSYLRHRRRTR